ncbi:uncharacterized protein LOC119279354 [Triticum dicoccoides]|uniref:uncharacterized protein LOC119279354 n=1 Tax=Triticum dicoccoides TaxID=85692 RepID=UPI0018902326|nr:uncharacterized protein LOC119279354 [Triticum dicoccoides]
MLREALQHASVMEEHRFEASLLAALAKDAEVSKLQQKLKLADDEIDSINKRFDEAQGSATEVETLKSALAEAKEEARASKAATDKAAADLEAEKVARRQYEARVTKVEQAFQDTANKCESLEESNKAQAAELTKALQEAKEARTESWAAREEIKQAEQIAADAFADLSRSAADAAQYFRAQEGNAAGKLFWSHIPFTPPTSVLSPSVTSYSQARPKDDACDAYRIAALAYDPFHPSHSGYYLCTYDSKDPRWRRTPAASPQPPPPEDFVSSKVITIRRSGSGSCSGIMGWVDLWSGMLLCDVLAAAADTLCIPLHYLTFPEPRQLRTELPLATDIGYHFRDIALANDSGIIRFVDLQVHAEPSPRSQTPSGWTVVTWTLEGLNGGLDALFFRQEHEIHSGHIHGYNLPQSLFVSNPILSSDRDGVLYLLTNASSENTNNMPSKVIALDLNQKMLLDVQEFDRQRPSSYMTTSISSYLMPAAAVSKEKESMKRRAPKSMGSARKKQPAIANPAAVGGKGDVGDAMDLSQ